MQRAEAQPLPAPLCVTRCNMLDALPSKRSSGLSGIDSLLCLKDQDRAEDQGRYQLVLCTDLQSFPAKRQQASCSQGHSISYN